LFVSHDLPAALSFAAVLVLIVGVYLCQFMVNLQVRVCSYLSSQHIKEFELARTLGAIRSAVSDVNQPYEIIVADDASTDATAEIASEAGATVIPINRRQVAAARNVGGTICSSLTPTRGSRRLSPMRRRSQITLCPRKPRGEKARREASARKKPKVIALACCVCLVGSAARFTAHRAM
jgi:hypothetical protein